MLFFGKIKSRFMLISKKKEEEYIVSLFQVNRFNTLFADIVEKQLNELLSVPGNKVVFNLQGIRFIDSEGFRILKAAKAISDKNGSKFLLCNLHEDVKELISLLSIDNYFEVCHKEINNEEILLEVE